MAASNLAEPHRYGTATSGLAFEERFCRERIRHENAAPTDVERKQESELEPRDVPERVLVLDRVVNHDLC